MSAIRETGREGIQWAILEYLAAKRILAFRNNVAVAKFGKRTVRFGVPGMADITAYPQVLCSDGEWRAAILHIEVKAPGAKGQSLLQKSYQQQVEDHGHVYRVCRSIEDVDEALAEVQRRW